jgi:wyosine [tRNA(Phe)-imidazoG37] synthetase (radical SAM superfamily)
VSLDALARELQAARSVAADHITFSGTGEPTLASNLGQAIQLAKSLLGLPVAVLTNSSLMAREAVRQDLGLADVVVAKLDAPNERLFRRINRPVVDCRLEEVFRGISLFRAGYEGRLALQMMFVEANKGFAAEMAAIARQLSLDEVQINTPLRPCAVAPLTANEISAIRQEFRGLPVVSVYEAARPAVTPLDVSETLRRRPSEAPPDC